MRRATLVYVRKEGKILLAHAHFSGPWELPKRNENFLVIEGRANYESVRRARELERARARPELTARQRRVIDCLGRGLTCKEIGEVMNISERNVRYYVSALIYRYRVENKTQLIAAAYRAEQGEEK